MVCCRGYLHGSLLHGDMQWGQCPGFRVCGRAPQVPVKAHHQSFIENRYEIHGGGEILRLPLGKTHH